MWIRPLQAPNELKCLDPAIVWVQIAGMSTHAIATMGSKPSFSSLVLRFAGALLAIAIATIAGLLIARTWGSAPVVLLYIPPVVGAAVYCGLWPALAASLAASLAFNYYFTAPYHTFMIHSPTDVVTVVVLFFVAVVTSQLVAMLRVQAQLAAAHAARNATIAGFARRLLSCTAELEIAEAAVQEISQLFHANAVWFSSAETPQVVASSPTAADLSPDDFAAAAYTIDTGEASGRGLRRLHIADWQFHPVVSNDAVLAAVGLAREDGIAPVAQDQQLLLSNLLDQTALAFERVRLELEARNMAGLRERDRLRAAMLTSIGEDVKPRLNAIGAAARELKRQGLCDKMLVANVAAEVVKLDRYIDNLVDLHPGSNQEPIEIGSLTIDLHRRAVFKEGEEVHLTPKEYDLLTELAKHAGRVLPHVHLLRAVWGPAQADQIDYLRVAIRSIRQKLEVDPANPALILNEPKVGYRLAVQ